MITSSPGSSSARMIWPSTGLAPPVDDDLVQVVVETVVLLELRLNRPLQVVGAVDGRVLRLSLVDRRMGRRTHALVGLEIRLAGGEVDDVAALLFELDGQGEDMGRSARAGNGRERG